jgi:peptide-methionine (R)-S-oxide reductase
MKLIAGSHKRDVQLKGQYLANHLSSGNELAQPRERAMTLKTTIDRRTVLLAIGTGVTLVGVGAWWRMPVVAAVGTFEVEKSEEDWKKLLSPETFQVMRKEATERPFTSPLLEEHRDGVFACAACDLPLYAAKAKYDSGTGWPSFFDHLPEAVGLKEDDTLFATRTEVHCRRCGGHLGHVFDDGPQPTGKRYCMNGVALKFIPGAKTGA